MSKLMERHSDRDVLETCSKTLETLCTEGTAIFTRCDVSRSNIIDTIVNRYKEDIDDWRNLIEGEETPNEDEIYNVIIILRKVSILFSCHNLNPCNLFESLYKDIDDCLGGDGNIIIDDDKCLPNEAVVYCIESAFYSLSWGLYHLENNCDASSFDETSKILQTNLDRYMSACTKLVRSGKTIQIQEASYKSICDLLITFSSLLAIENVQLKELVYIASDELQQVLNEFVQKNVFSSQEEDGHDETKIEELHKKRNYLAAYCKLVVYNNIPVHAAADIFKHYLKVSFSYFTFM